MKLHRLRLKNFRGIAEREVEFADAGVTVVAGRNEAGKSSMVEALDTLLEVRASSKSAAVKALSPSGQDVGTEVEAEISSGGWHFTYFKRFNRSVATELTVHAPEPEQHTGRDAEARAAELLSGTMDLALFRAVRLMQSDDPELVAATGSAALTKALDRAVGAAEVADGDAEELLAAVTAEYCRYFTEKAGRPTGELAAAQQRVAAAHEDYAARARGIEAVARDAEALEAALSRKVELARTAELRRVDAARVDDRLAAAEAALVAYESAQKSLQLAAATAALAERDVDDRVSRRSRLTSLRQRESDAVHRRDTSTTNADAAASAAVAAEVELAAARAEADAQLAAATQSRQRQLDEARKALADNNVDSAVLAGARKLARDLATDTARWEAAAASFSVEALGDRVVTVDGRPVTDAQFRTGAGESVVEVDGVARVTITAGADTEELARTVESLSAQAADVCATHRLATLDDAQARADERAELTRRIARLTGELEAPGPVEGAAAVAAAERRVAAQRSAERENRAAAQTSAAELHRINVDVDELCGQIASADTELTDEQAHLTQEEARRAKAVAQRAVAAARAELEVLAVADLERQRATLRDELAKLDRQIAATEREIVTTSTRIEVCRTDNRLDELNDAAAELADAEHALSRVTERAAAAQLLFVTLRAKRQESHARYADPFRTRLEELSAPLFGAGVRFAVDDDLTITSRTVDGVTVPYESLSGGAREQLGLVARLACAMLVDEADGVPVIIDDALGNSDTARTETMADVLTQAGKHSQVIVLTCVPERYAHVDAASKVAV
ncbi:AAA family ATPase [Gordonia sp. TBRC 11910]|uniref:AAA family ATPase n=1 Tax=Gordonia asplenii TaxID=2725283 RepID=A0A848KXK8_9ACTN|nr:AAA family ATPase [Gordonia asplenii]NMO01183.1 AAA family ATPase [Gordonia asplenii]